MYVGFQEYSFHKEHPLDVDFTYQKGDQVAKSTCDINQDITRLWGLKPDILPSTTKGINWHILSTPYFGVAVIDLVAGKLNNL